MVLQYLTWSNKYLIDNFYCGVIDRTVRAAGVGRTRGCRARNRDDGPLSRLQPGRWPVVPVTTGTMARCPGYNRVDGPLSRVRKYASPELIE